MFERVTEWLARRGPIQSVVAKVVSTWQVGRPLTKPSDYREFAAWYRRNVLAAACVWEIATSAAEPKLQVFAVNTKGEETPAPDCLLAQLLAKPNVEQSQFEFVEGAITQQQVAGQFYMLKDRQRPKGPVIGLRTLAPHRMSIVPNADGTVRGYAFVRDGDTQFIDAGDVIHGPLHPDVLDEFYGLSPIAVLARYGDLDDLAIDYLRAFFDNNGTPAGILKYKHTISDPVERELIKEKWKNEHTGMGGWHSVSVLDSDVDYKDVGATPKDLNLEKLFSETETRICMAFGVPPILVGAQAGLLRATYANYAAARRSLWDETLSPLYRRNGDFLTNGLAPEFNQPNLRYVIRFDISGVQALQEQAETKRVFAMDAFAGNLARLNEARVIAGLLPLEGDPRGEQFYYEIAGATPADTNVPAIVDATGSKNQHNRAAVRAIMKEAIAEIREQEHARRSERQAQLGPHAAGFRRVARGAFRDLAGPLANHIAHG